MLILQAYKKASNWFQVKWISFSMKHQIPPPPPRSNHPLDWSDQKSRYETVVVVAVVVVVVTVDIVVVIDGSMAFKCFCNHHNFVFVVNRSSLQRNFRRQWSEAAAAAFHLFHFLQSFICFQFNGLSFESMVSVCYELIQSLFRFCSFQRKINSVHCIPIYAFCRSEFSSQCLMKLYVWDNGVLVII